MKTSLLKFGFLLATILSLAAPGLLAQTATNNPIVDSPIFQFLSQSSTNWFVAPYGIATTTGNKYGAGIAVGYKLSDYVAPVMRLDDIDGTLWMPSASLQLQVPIIIMGKVTVIPFSFAGIATPLAGAGNLNGSAVGIFGAGAAFRLSSRFDVVGDVEKWSNFPGQQIRFGFLYKF